MSVRATSPRSAAWAAVTLLLLLALAPRFASIYRSAAFDTLPRDPYETYLLHLAGEPGGIVPGAPHVYRLFSVAAALPAYHALPVYRFSNLPDTKGRNAANPVDDRMLRAHQAMAALSTLAIAGLCLAMFGITRRLGASRASALLAALLAYALVEGTNMMAMDTFALCAVGVLAAAAHRPWLFIPLMLAAAGFNEKIPLLFALLYAARTLVDRSPRWIPQLAAACAAIALYLGARALWPAAGHEHVGDPATYASALTHMAALTFSAKGVVQNLLPALCVALLWFVARLHPAASSPSVRNVFHPADGIALVGLLVVSFAARIDYGVGRIALYAFPLYLPAAVAALATLERLTPNEAATSA